MHTTWRNAAGRSRSGATLRWRSAWLLAAWLGLGAAAAADAPRLKVAVSKTALSLPLYVAQEQGYFEAEGLDIQMPECIGGYRCLRQLLDGQVDFATVGDMPLALESFARKDFALLATLATTVGHVKLVAHTRAAVKLPGDLAGKRVGVVPGSASQYFFELTLLAAGVDPRAIAVVELHPEVMAQALLQGQVDTVAIWEPFASQALNLLGRDGHRVAIETSYLQTFNLVSQRRLVGAQDAVLVRLLKALERAVEFIHARPVEAKLLLGRHLQLGAKDVDALWGGTTYRLSLDQSLLSALESEARWALREGHVSGKLAPNFLDLIHSAPLKTLKPAAVGIAR